jgi:hypothetical protein
MDNAIIGYLNTIRLFITKKIQFDNDAIGKMIEVKNKEFKIFRRVRILNRKEPKAFFLIRFRPIKMTIEQNIRFSRIAMMIFMGFKGFCSKYWAVDMETGLCQGFYEWETEEDAIRYSKSIAMKFMKKRSDPKTIEYWIINKENESIDYRIY